MCCALPFGEEARFVCRKLTQLFSLRSSNAGRRAASLSTSDSCSTKGSFAAVVELIGTLLKAFRFCASEVSTSGDVAVGEAWEGVNAPSLLWID
jgi:hypothetical protein